MFANLPLVIGLAAKNNVISYLVSPKYLPLVLTYNESFIVMSVDWFFL